MRVLFLNKKQCILQNALLTNAHMEMDDGIGRKFYFQMIFVDTAYALEQYEERGWGSKDEWSKFWKILVLFQDPKTFIYLLTHLNYTD